MQPFTFATPRADWTRFVAESDRWKPSGFDGEMALRLAYFLDQALPDLKAELHRRFPETDTKMTPVTVPFVTHIVREQAKVFLADTKLELQHDGDAPVDEEIVRWWKYVQEQMGLGLRLKKVDAYTTLLRTAGLRIGYDKVQGRFTAHVIFPQQLRVVMDPAAPMDLDRAHGVAVEIASEGGLQGSGPRRWEFWCARAGEERHSILEVSAEDAKVVDEDKGDPLRDADDRAMVPIVLFTAHTEELGLFTMEGADLIPTARALNVMLTDIHHIAEQQGFGVMVVTAPNGEDTPSKIVRAPNTAIALKGGVKAEFINANAPIGDLLALVDARLKQAAIFYGLPAGAVSIEARAAASGIALQIEMRPLMELRSDAIEVYREPMRRVWTLVRATHDLYGAEAGVGQLPEDLRMRWEPGDIQTPSDDQSRVDTILARLKSRLISRVEAIAEDRGISLEEAEKVAAAIDKADPKPPSQPADLLALTGRRAALQEPPPGEEEPVDPAPEE
jgi:hypothetical protein